MDIVITGACGLVGFNACKYFKERGHNIIAIDNLERSALLGHEVSETRKHYNRLELEKLGIRISLVDVSLEDTWLAIGKADAVVHLAGQCGVPTSIKNPRRDFEINTVGTFNALEYARTYGAKLIYASTNKVYPIHGGWWLENKRWRWGEDLMHREGFPTRPMDKSGRTPYGASKYAGDVLVQEYGDIFDLKTACFRMSCIYGPNQMGFEEQGWAMWFAIATLKGLPITIYGDGYQVRDMLWVEDLVRAYEAFLVNDIKSGVWNIGGGPKFTLSLNECLDILYEITGNRSQVIYKDWRPYDQRVYTSNISKAHKELKWSPSITPREGMEKAVKWAEGVLDIF